MKAYWHVRLDLADSAAVIAAAAANPTSFPLGNVYVAADGTATIIIDDAGTGKLMTVAV
jgi:hypothetical protein